MMTDDRLKCHRLFNVKLVLDRKEDALPSCESSLEYFLSCFSPFFYAFVAVSLSKEIAPEFLAPRMTETSRFAVARVVAVSW